MKIFTLTLTYNRLPLLQRCINSIRNADTKAEKIIVVDNSDNDLTYNWCKEQNDITYIKGDNSLGVIARNKGIEYLNSEKLDGIIVQVDDDAVLFKHYGNIIEKYFSDHKIGAIGQQAYHWDGWLQFNPNVKVGEECNFFTGYLWAFRVKENWKYSEKLGNFWHEESTCQLPIALDGYTLIRCEDIGAHASHRVGDVDWNLHNKNLDLNIEIFKPKIDDLYKKGIQFFKLWSVERYTKEYLK